MMIHYKAKNRSGVCSWGVILFLLACIVMNAGNTYAQKIDEEKITRIMAGFIYHLSKLVTWPENKFNTDETPIVVGFVGKDPKNIVEYFKSQSRSATAQGRNIEVNYFDDVKSFTDTESSQIKKLQQCHILFIAASEEDRLDKILMAIEGTNVLTTGETESFLFSGGMVAFVTENNRMKIKVNLSAVEKAGINISAQFLQHATIVKWDKKPAEVLEEPGHILLAQNISIF